MSDISKGTHAEAVARFRQAVVEDLELISLLHDRELDRDTLLALRKHRDEDFLGFRLQSAEADKALALFRQGLAGLPLEIDDETWDLLAAEYADIYLNHSIGASPCESVWLDEDHLALQEPMFQIRTWYARYGIAVEDWRKRSDDHLVNQLRFVAHLMRTGKEQDLFDESALFLDEHLLRWIGDFAKRVGGRADTMLYAGLAQLTATYLYELRETLAQLTGKPIPDPEQIEETMRAKTAVPVAAPAPYVPGAEPSW